MPAPAVPFATANDCPVYCVGDTKTTNSTYFPPVTDNVEKQLREYPVEEVIDGCTAAAHIAYACSDAAFIYPITPSSSMAEIYEVWASQGRINAFGAACVVKQLQSEAGAAGAVHGSLSVGAVTTTFTASQGLLLMIPPMYKISGELIPCVFHVSARAVAGQALSIFGDHSDVMAVRQCGWALLSSASVQEAEDMALIAHMATMKAKVPFVHFFDGFRTSHELQKIKIIDYWTARSLLDFDAIEAFRHRSLNPTHPFTKGTAQGPDVYFQNLEVANKYYQRVPEIIEQCMADFAKKVGRTYKLFEYYGDEDAEHVAVIIGAGGPVIEETIDYMKRYMGRKAGLVTVKLYRPWRLERFIEALPKTVKVVCALDRTKEPGSLGEPLFLDVAASLQSAGLTHVKCVGGRFGLGSKDFHPGMVLAVFDNMASVEPKHGFTVGIQDDVTHMSLPYEHHSIDSVPDGTRQCMFWGMGQDGTVGANKNVIKILGMNTPMHVQGYFAYSAHKAGGLTVSHLRFGPREIKSQYLLNQTDYVAVHRAIYIKNYDCVGTLKRGGIFVLNTNWTSDEIEKEIPGHVKKFLADREVKMHIIDANKVAAENGMGRRINNVLMTAFFKLSGVLPFEQAIELFKRAIEKTYGKKGKHVVTANWNCVDAAVEAVSEYKYDATAWKGADTSRANKVWTNTRHIQEPPTFVQGVMLALEKMDGDSLPTSAFEEFAGGILPPGTAGYEKRAIALNVPVVDMDKCTQCNQCSFVCPHAAIRPFLIDDEEAEKAPAPFIMKKAKGYTTIAPYKYRIQVAPLDCTGCELCYIACPDDALRMVPLDEVRHEEEPNWNFAIGLKDRSEDLEPEQRLTLKGSQYFQPMVEFSGACEGCGETPYVKLLTQLFGERLIIANATGCSSIWGASYPANAYTVNQKGLGPAWGNSLFEDNAEYGYGMAIATAHRRDALRNSVEQALSNDSCTKLMSVELRSLLSEWLLNWRDAIICQKVFEKACPLLMQECHNHPLIRTIASDKDLLPRISQWIVGGDGWAYDIGFGGVDHVLASGVDVNFLILDTEVYSNTGGQQSKATTLGAVHKFATGGRLRNKKDLGALCMEYGDVYVASCASSANMTQTVRSFIEAESFEGPSVILAYSPCIEHQYIKPFNLQIEHCKLAVDSGYWPLYRYNPSLHFKGENPFQLDSRKIKASIVDLMKKENRFGTLRRSSPQLAEELERQLQAWALERFEKYRQKAVGVTAAASGGANAEEEKNTWNVIYGSETGNAEDVAKRIGAMLKERQVPAKVLQMDEIGVEEVSAMHKVLIVCSTAGQGELPGNAKALHEALEKETGSELLQHVQYAVMGLGDSAYVYFNQAAKLFDKEFQRLGAKRVIETGMGDDQAEEGYETALAEFLGTFMSESGIPEPQNVSTEPAQSLFEIVLLEHPAEYKQCVHHGSQVVKLVRNIRMTPDDYDVDVRHLEFDLSGTNLRYALGDSLAIWPHNDPDDVTEFCEYFGLNPDQWISVKPANGMQAGPKFAALFSNPITVRQLFTEVLDIFGKPSRSVYEQLWRYCMEATEKSVARNILAKENKPEFDRWTKQEYTNSFDLLKKFPSTKQSVNIARLIDLIPLIKPRYYSIASSQKYVSQNALHLCIGIVDWTTSMGKKRLGQCTGYVSRSWGTKEKPVTMCASLKATAFNLPPTEKHPIIVAGMGTGLAPFRAFIQHRAFLHDQGRSPGPLVVYFGCRYSKKDFLYGDELKGYEARGVITDLRTAFSRDQKEKHYIQHEIVGDPDLFYRRMVEEDGYFYLCGSAKQVPIDIRKAVREVLKKKAGMNEEEAEETVTQWQIKGKYNVEAW